MLEVTLRDDRGAAYTFPFENDALQAYLTNLAAEGACQFISLRALGVPLVVTGEMPKAKAKTAGPGAPREPAKQPTSAPKPPVGSTPAKPATPEKK